MNAGKTTAWLKDNWIYPIMFVMIFIVHLQIVPSVDDLWFREILDSYNIWSFTAERYATWASRSLIEALLVVITRMPVIVWRVLDSFIYVAIAWLFGRIIGERDRYVKGVASMLWLTYPFIQMNSAGYIATTLNYTWPLVCILGFMYLLKRVLAGEKLSVWQCGLSVVCILYGANTEQGTAVIIGICVVVAVWRLFRKEKLPVMFWIWAAAAVAEALYILTCPGNSARIAYETEHLFPEYAAFSLFRKVEVGATSAMYHFLFIENMIFFLFTLVLWLTARRLARNAWEKAVCMTPLVLSLCFSMFSSVFYTWFPRLEYMRYSLTPYGTLASGEMKTVFPCVVYLVAVLAILYSFYLFGRENLLQGLLLAAFIAIGFGSRLMMGFSASIWASSDRTYLFMYSGFIFATVYMLKLTADEKVRSGILGLTVLTGLAAWTSLLVSFL